MARFLKPALLALMCQAAVLLPSAAMSPVSGDTIRSKETARAVQVAQMQPDVYVGERGELIYVDPYTRQIIAVEPPPSRQQRRMHRVENYPQDAYDRRGARDTIGGFAKVPEERARRAYPGADLEALRQGNDRDEMEGMPEPRRVQRTPLPVEPRSEPRTRVTSVPKEKDTRTTGSVAKPAPTEVSRPKVTEPVIAATNSTLLAKVQVLLDRMGTSSGAIDGVKGSNVAKALAAYAEMHGKPLDVTDEKKVDAMLEASGGPAFVSYTITNADAAGPYVASVPADYGEKAKLEKMAFTSPAEAIAEKFHMDEAYLMRLNAGKNFNQPGTVIKVANPGMRVLTPVARIVADKGRTQVRAYDDKGRLVAAYPATIGSSDTPSPSGTVTVERVAFNPEYTYNPKKNFQQGTNDKVLTIPPGPNGPVGSIWIALSKPTYGIHGTPEPSRIGKTNSHGCVRLTNWDADELARLVKPGTIVQFIE